MTKMTGHRWFGTGVSAHADAATAGRAAATSAVRGPDVRLLVVFASDDHDLPVLAAAVQEVAGPSTPVIGCTTAGEITTSGAATGGVVVAALGGDGFRVAAAMAEGAAADLRRAGAAVAASVESVGEGPHRVLMLLSDGLAGDQHEVVRGAYAVVGAAVPLVGGCAGDDLRMRRTRQLFGGRVCTDAVVGAAIVSDAPIGIGVRHGWRRVGEPMLVTASTANRVHLLDDEPALDVYLDRLRAPESARHDADAFTRFALTHPLGLSRRSREEVRFVNGADLETRSLSCIAEVPQGGLAWLMEGDRTSVLQGTHESCEDARAPLDGDPIGVLAFDCIARRAVLADGAAGEEVRVIADHFPGAPVAGFYTYGEIARTRGGGGFHNQTLVVLAFS